MKTRRRTVAAVCDRREAEDQRSQSAATNEGPKLETILDAEVLEKYTLTDYHWNYLQPYAE